MDAEGRGDTCNCGRRAGGEVEMFSAEPSSRAVLRGLGCGAAPCVHACVRDACAGLRRRASHDGQSDVTQPFGVDMTDHN